jgi:lysophospholipase L1-like esterase
MRVLVIGNSVALYVRPRAPGARPYGHRLTALLSSEADRPGQLEIWAGNSLTVADLLRDFEDRLIGVAPDVVVVNVGIVECTPRAVPQRLRRSYVRGRTSWQRLWITAESIIRRPILALTGGAPAMTPAAFGTALQRLVEVARGESGARVFCLGLPPTSDRIIVDVPGMAECIRTYDAVVQAVSNAAGATYVNVAALVAREGLETALPDGIHFSDRGHEAVAQEIARLVGSTDGAPPAPVASTATAGVPAAMRIPGAVAAVPLVALSVLWQLGAKSWRALQRLRPR